jgi:hypothetical protein
LQARDDEFVTYFERAEIAPIKGDYE